MCNSQRIALIHMSSAVVFVMNLYSVSVLERDTVVCFLTLQKMRFEPRKIVDFLSSEQSAQSASKKSVNKVESDFLISKPMCKVC
jgi:hypothetical protein